MKVDNGITWPEEWGVHASRARSDLYWVGTDLEGFRVFRSGGNESLWYVEQYDPVNKDITGQCETLEIAIHNLRNYLAGVPVPDGDEITVFIPGEAPFTAPVFHNSKGERFVHVPEKS